MPAFVWWGICKSLPLLWLPITFLQKVGSIQRKEAEPADSELPKNSRSWFCYCSRMNFISQQSGTCKRRTGERAGTPGFASFPCPDFSLFLSLSIPFLPICKFIIWEPFPPTSSGDSSSFPLHWNTKDVLSNGVLRCFLSMVIEETLKTVHYKFYFSHNQARKDLRP